MILDMSSASRVGCIYWTYAYNIGQKLATVVQTPWDILVHMGMWRLIVTNRCMYDDLKKTPALISRNALYMSVYQPVPLLDCQPSFHSGIYSHYMWPRVHVAGRCHVVAYRELCNRAHPRRRGHIHLPLASFNAAR